MLCGNWGNTADECFCSPKSKNYKGDDYVKDIAKKKLEDIVDADTTEWATTGAGLATAFSKLDKEGAGAISVEKLGDAIRQVAPKSTDAEIADMVALADSDGDGEVTLSEFVMLMLFKNEVPREAVGAK